MTHRLSSQFVVSPKIDERAKDLVKEDTVYLTEE